MNDVGRGEGRGGRQAPRQEEGTERGVMCGTSYVATRARRSTATTAITATASNVCASLPTYPSSSVPLLHPSYPPLPPCPPPSFRRSYCSRRASPLSGSSSHRFNKHLPRGDGLHERTGDMDRRASRGMAASHGGRPRQGRESGVPAVAYGTCVAVPSYGERGRERKKEKRERWDGRRRKTRTPGTTS